MNAKFLKYTTIQTLSFISTRTQVHKSSHENCHLFSRSILLFWCCEVALLHPDFNQCSTHLARAFLEPATVSLRALKIQALQGYSKSIEVGIRNNKNYYDFPHRKTTTTNYIIITWSFNQATCKFLQAIYCYSPAVTKYQFQLPPQQSCGNSGCYIDSMPFT